MMHFMCKYISKFVAIIYSVVWFYSASTIVGNECQIHFYTYKQLYNNNNNNNE